MNRFVILTDLHQSCFDALARHGWIPPPPFKQGIWHAIVPGRWRDSRHWYTASDLSEQCGVRTEPAWSGGLHENRTGTGGRWNVEPFTSLASIRSISPRSIRSMHCTEYSGRYTLDDMHSAPQSDFLSYLSVACPPTANLRQIDVGSSTGGGKTWVYVLMIRRHDARQTRVGLQSGVLRRTEY